MVLGPTMATLAESASCPVAIIRPDDASRSRLRVVVVTVHRERTGCSRLEKACLRSASLLALGVRHLDGQAGLTASSPNGG